MNEKLYAALKRLFSCPNWQNRMSPWKDIHDATFAVHEAFQSCNGEGKPSAWQEAIVYIEKCERGELHPEGLAGALSVLLAVRGRDG